MGEFSMVPLLLLLGGFFSGIVAYAVLANWDAIVDWFKNEFLPKIAEMWEKFKSNVVHAAKVFADKVIDAGEWLVRIIHQLYYQKPDGQWIEQTTTRACSEDEVPDWVKAKAKTNTKTDITGRMEQELQMEI